MALKLRTKVQFPATVTATGGLKIVKSNGVWTVSPDFAQLAALTGATVADPSQKQVWLYDPGFNQYNVLTLSGLGDALYLASSTTSNSIGMGAKTFTTQANKDIGVGSFVLAVSANGPANYLFGQVIAYSGTALTMNATLVGGSGTYTDWTIRAAGAGGATGLTGAGYAATSATGNTIANTGSKTFAVGTGLAYSIGARVRATESAGSTVWMEGVVTAYTGGNLTFTADKKIGAGTFSAWTLNVAGEPGSGDLLSTNNLSDVTSATTARANLGLGGAATQNTGMSGANVPMLNGKNTWTNVQTPSASALTSGAGADFSTSQVWMANVNGSTFAIANPSANPAANSYIAISVTFTTNNTLAFGTNFKTAGYSQSTSGKDHLVFYWNGTTYELVGVRNATNS